jgi:hypothetical protein
MAKFNKWFMAAGMAALVGTATIASAQDNNGGQGGRRNFDPAQMQQRIMESAKERLEITDETEWKAIQPLVQKVMDAQRAVMGDRIRGMMGGNRRGGPGGGGPGGDNNGGPGQRGGGGGMFGQASPEADALQRAIDGKASATELKQALTKFVEGRKTRQAALEKAQADLRKVLTPRQEAIATLSGQL